MARLWNSGEVMPSEKRMPRVGETIVIDRLPPKIIAIPGGELSFSDICPDMWSESIMRRNDYRDMPQKLVYWVRPLSYYKEQLDNYEEMADSGKVLSAAEKERYHTLVVEIFRLPEESTLGLRPRTSAIEYLFVANEARHEWWKIYNENP